MMIVRMDKRQAGLDNQMLIDNREVMVYDHREIIDLESLTIKMIQPGLIFCDSSNFNQNIPIFDRKSKYYVSAYFKEGIFNYSCMGESSSTPEFVAVEVKENKIDKVIDELVKEKADKIVFGREIVYSKLVNYVNEFRNTNINQKIKDFYELNVDEQKAELERLLDLDLRMRGK